MFSNALDQLKLVEFVFGDAESRQDLAHRGERRTRSWRAVIEWFWGGRHNIQGRTLHWSETHDHAQPVTRVFATVLKMY